MLPKETKKCKEKYFIKMYLF